MPRMPSRRPLTSVPSNCVGAQPDQVPARTIRSPSPARRAAARISSIAHSAVATLSTSGVFTTASPRARAAATSMWSNPTLNVPSTRTLPGSAAITAASSFSAGQHSTASAPCARSISSAPLTAWSSSFCRTV